MGDPGLPSATVDERALLASRVIPTMTLSTAENPLTSPLPRITDTNPSSRALSRFAVEGNAVITGGAGALGLVSARALLEHGASAVALLDLPGTLKSSEDAIQQLQTDFPNSKIITSPVDVTSSTTVDQSFDKVAQTLGGIHILCCFAGIVGCVNSTEVTQSQFQKVVDVNLTGSFLCAQAAARYMIQQGKGGSIVFTASISAHHTNFPQPQVAYNVSKAAVAHLTRNLAAEWCVHGIRVNCISPGYMDTVLNAGDNLKEIRAIWASRCPMGRMGDVEEITAPLITLCSARAGRYITGADLLVDGGAMCL